MQTLVFRIWRLYKILTPGGAVVIWKSIVAANAAKCAVTPALLQTGNLSDVYGQNITRSYVVHLSFVAHK